MIDAPVVYEGRSVAVLKLISGEPDFFGQSDIAILNAFCACIAETIAREEIAQENRKLLLDYPDRECRSHGRIIDDLLEAGRVSSGKIRLTTEIVDIADVVHLSIEASQPLCDERGQRLFINGNSTRLVQALNNLLNNASKFSPPNSTITLEVGPRGGSVMVRVTDHGGGISPDALAMVFDLFVQEHPPGAHPDEGGLGIVLTLVRAIAELHVEAKNSGTGRGSAFSLWLPLAQAPEQGAMLPSTPREAASQLDVLVVDDNRDSADSMTLLVDMLGNVARALTPAHSV